MQYPYISNFPESVDELIHFHDIDIDELSIMEEYNNLIIDENYTAANVLLSQQEVHSYSADLFNYMEAMLKTTQTYVLEQEKYNPIFHSSTLPNNLKDGDVWVG